MGKVTFWVMPLRDTLLSAVGQVECHVSWVGAGPIEVNDFWSTLGSAGNFGIVHWDSIFNFNGKSPALPGRQVEFDFRRHPMVERVYEFSARTLMGLEKSLSDYEGKVLLIVNTASKCGFTPQYEGLQALYDAYRDRGFEVLGFPSNQFGKQEPGDAEEIRQFCSVNYGVTFDMFDKIKVNGPDTHPLYRYLKSSVPGFMGTKAIEWNFTKFLVDREGHVRERYGSKVEPEAIAADIEDLLEA